MNNLVKLIKANEADADTLLKVQRKAFKKYIDKYGDFESNPYHMSKKRLLFSINYHYGQYYKIVDENDEIIGGLFGFLIEEGNMIKIAQFYLKDEYQATGIGSYVLNEFFKMNPQITCWYIDTIMQEEYNVEFYKHLGFNVIDEEEEHEGLTFVTMIKK